MESLSRLGKGLSPPQRSDFQWFKEAWDARMAAMYKEKWPETFASFMERVILDYEEGSAVAAFSQFVHGETCRILAGQERMLQVPACS